MLLPLEPAPASGNVRESRLISRGNRGSLLIPSVRRYERRVTQNKSSFFIFFKAHARSLPKTDKGIIFNLNFFGATVQIHYRNLLQDPLTPNLPPQIGKNKIKR